MTLISSQCESPVNSTSRLPDRVRRLIVMTRIPEAGRVKTRLIPGVGAEGAAAVHHALLERTLRTADLHQASRTDIGVDVRFTGNNEAVDAFRIGSAVWREQQGNNLGERMHLAISAAIEEVARAVVVIGTDCPDISLEILDRAWNMLDSHDLVLGPAEDGGYYLIAIKQPDARIFEGIAWGTEHVLRQTLDRCRALHKTVGLLPALGDIDEAENLIACRRIASGFENCLPQAQPGLLSVIIPTLNEAGQLESTLQPLLREPDCEIIVVDGGSTDDTVERAKQLGCRVVLGNRGRGKQLNAGAALSRGEHLLFLHADTQVPANFRDELLTVLNGGAIAGAFRFQIQQPGWGLRWVEWGTNLRARFLQLPYGDQGFFLRASDFFQIGGFQNWPIMEDFELCRRLKTRGRIAITNSPAPTSGRRWKRLGAIRNTMVNQVCLAMYFCGVSPERIARFYRGSQGQPVKKLPSASKGP